MLKFDEQKKLENIKGALKLRPSINKMVDEIYKRGFSNVCWLGIGGTYASSDQAVIHMKEKSKLETFYENAAGFLTTGNKRVTKDTLVVISSVTGSTEEMVEAVKKCNQIGATVLGFIDKEDAHLATLVDYLISYPLNEQLKFFMVADRIMQLAGEFEEYDEFYAEMDAHFAEGIINIEKMADEFGKKFAEKHYQDPFHYFVSAGNYWGGVYSYAMCYWEEQHWLRTKSIKSEEFFHGMFEIVDRDTPVTIYITEDSQRPLSERVANFIPQICANYTIIDAKDYPMPGISAKFRGALSPFIFPAINNRIDVHIERLNCHPMEIRRYYRQLKY